jgi:hypothetical protein
MPGKIIIGALALTGGLTIAACSSGATAGPASSAPASPAAAAPASSPAQPETAAGARAAAKTFFALYSASQWAAAYQYISPAAQRVVSEATWAKVHQRCPSKAAGLAYTIKGVTLAGDTAVIRYGLSGALAGLGSAVQVFTYSGGRWGFTPSPADLAMYRGHTVGQAVAAMKAEGDCAS